ncbi:MAG: recombinase A [Polyangiaceae bacterium]
MGLPLPLETLLSQFGSRVSFVSRFEERAAVEAFRPPVRGLGWPEFDALLPDGGLPVGVVEIAARHGLAGATVTALAAVRAAHAADEEAWCAWIDPSGTLHAPGAAMAGVALDRLFVVRPPREALPTIAVKIARAKAFAILVVDFEAPLPVPKRRGKRPRPSPDAVAELFVRKIALLAQDVGMTVLLLTDADERRAAPLPVALRLELAQSSTGIDVRVGKDRHGRIGAAKTIPRSSRPVLALTG